MPSAPTNPINNAGDHRSKPSELILLTALATGSSVNRSASDVSICPSSFTRKVKCPLVQFLIFGAFVRHVPVKVVPVTGIESGLSNGCDCKPDPLKKTSTEAFLLIACLFKTMINFTLSFSPAWLRSHFADLISELKPSARSSFRLSAVGACVTGPRPLPMPPKNDIHLLLLRTIKMGRLGSLVHDLSVRSRVNNVGFLSLIYLGGKRRVNWYYQLTNKRVMSH